MIRISDVLGIARRALHAQRAALNTTGHNIANASTEGYSRQRVIMSPTYPIHKSFGLIGTGVQVTDIERVRNVYLDAQIRTETSELGRWGLHERIYGELEVAMAEPSDAGLGTAMSKFWDSWQDLANNPESHAVRNVVQKQGSVLVETFHDIYNKVTSLQRNLNVETESYISQINSLGAQIAELNMKISTTESQGVNANDFRDKRDLLLDELSSLVDISTIETDNGMVNVTIHGEMFVGLTESREILTGTRAIGNVKAIYPHWSNTTEQMTLGGGKLGGIIDMQTEIIPDYLDRLDFLALSLVEQVNTLHQDGYGQDGSTGNLFFSDQTVGAYNIDLAPAIKNNVEIIAASADGSAGDSSVAMDINQVKTALVLFNNTTSLTDYYNTMITDLGLESEEAISLRANQEMFVDEIELKRQEASGVSLDEEMTDLIKYQRSFQAAAQLVSAVDEMMQTVINMI